MKMVKQKQQIPQQTGFKFSLAKVILNIILVFILISLVGVYLSYYMGILGEPEKFEVVAEPLKLETGNLSYEVEQFYPNMKFNHNTISYKIDPACSEKKKERMLEAFSELEDSIGIINFYPSVEADIEVSCSESSKKSPEKDFFIAGEGGAKEIIQTGKYNVVTNGVILLHGLSERAQECEWPNVELHELLHVFGFDHSKDENSLMYPYLESCGQKLDEAIINDLKKLYSMENLADLYFKEVSAEKRGRYLDFNISIKNSGVIDAENVVLSVFDEGKEVDDFDLDDISFGAGVNFQVKGLKISRSSESIELVIDTSDFIKELDENNNVVRLGF